MDGLAERIKELRLQGGLTLQQLGKEVDLSGSFLSQLERGESSVSLVALNNICKGLGVTLSEFFSGVGDVTPPEYRARGDAPASRHDVVVNTTNGAIKYRFISRDSPGKLEVTVGRFTKDDQLPVTSHEGEEYGYVLEGILRLTIASEIHTLHPGNSYHFPSATPHQYEAVGDQEVAVLWVKLL